MLFFQALIEHEMAISRVLTSEACIAGADMRVKGDPVSHGIKHVGSSIRVNG